MKSLQFIEVDTPAFEITSPMGPEQTWRFAVPTDYLPREVDCVPSISAIAFKPAVISLGEDLGERATLQITFKDHRHVMNGESFETGTFWGKWRARYGQKLRGRTVRWLNGIEGQDLEDMPTRHFFIDSVDGPTPDGIYTISAKDLLKFADDDRAQAPRLSNGRLAGGLNNSATSAVLTPTGIGNAEYPASGHLCFGGKEIVSFTRSGDSLTITRSQLGTPPTEHNSGDRAQLVLYYDGDDVADIVYDLFTTYAAIDPDYIPLADWQAETTSNLGVIYARAITEPTPVKRLVSELVEQAGLAVWWDELAQIVRLQVLKEIATDAATFDEEVILERSLKTKEQPDKRISQIWTYYGQRNPADRGDNDDNYRAALATVDLERETDYGGTLIRKITGKWIAPVNAAQRLNQVQMSRFRDPPRQFNFDLFPGTSVVAGQGYRLRWRQNQDVLGNVVEDGAPIQITRLAVEAGVIRVEAQEMLASGTVVLTNVILLTTTGSVLNWTVPDDWNDADNSIHVIGGGGGGAGGLGEDGGAGGGAGAYSGIANLNLTPGASISYRVGSGGTGANPGGSGTAGTDTWFNGASLGASSVGAKAGTGGSDRTSTGLGGAAGSGVGSIKTSGGRGGTGYDDSGGVAGGGGGGAAGGPNGNGATGGDGSGDRNAGTGGGGANGGSNGSLAPDGETGGNGGNNRFNYGGGNSTNPAGVDGGGGKGGNDGQAGSAGGPGEPLWTQTIAPIINAGPGGGGGGGGPNGAGGNGGNYGGGGGGGGRQRSGGNGTQGVIAIIYRGA